VGSFNKHISFNFYVLLLFLFVNSQAHSKKLRIVVLGSSTAYGEGATSKDNGWVGLLKSYVKSVDSSYEVTNLARPSITSYHILPTNTNTNNRPYPNPDINITKAISLDPSCVIISLPSNDIERNYSIREQINNFLIIMKTTNVPIYVTTTQPRNTDYDKRIKLKLLANYIKNNLSGIDFYNELTNNNGSLGIEYDSGDGVHLNDSSNQILFHFL